MDFVKCVFRDSKGKTIESFSDEKSLIEFLQQVPRSELALYAPAIRGLYILYQFALKLVQQSAYIPQFLRVSAKKYRIRWIPAILNPVVQSMLHGVTALVPTNILYYKNGKEINEPIDSDKTTALLSLFINYLVQTNQNLHRKFKEHEIGHLFFGGAILQFNEYENKEYPTAIQLWLNKFFMAEKDYVPVIHVSDIDDGFSVQIAVQDKTKALEALISLEALFADDTYNMMRLDILRDLAMLSEYFPQISSLVASKGKISLYFNSEEFVDILFKILPTIRLFGIKVLLPKALRKLMRPQMSMILQSDEDENGVVKKQSLLNMDNMLDFHWRIALGDKLLTQADFLKMVQQFKGIVKLNDQFVFFDEKEIAALIEKLQNPPELNSNELLHIALTEDYKGAKVQLDKSTRDLMDKLLTGEGTEVPKGLKATLRPYQLTGYQWMYKNARIGFGSLIADDMGLGKTLQVITTLLKLKEDGELGKHLSLIHI